MSKTDRCMTPECTQKTYSRGVCRDCYQEYYAAVRREETTWTALEAEGSVLRSHESKRRVGGVGKKRGYQELRRKAKTELPSKTELQLIVYRLATINRGIEKINSSIASVIDAVAEIPEIYKIAAIRQIKQRLSDTLNQLEPQTVTKPEPQHEVGSNG